jgi:hypothetical protein
MLQQVNTFFFNLSIYILLLLLLLLVYILGLWIIINCKFGYILSMHGSILLLYLLKTCCYELLFCMLIDLNLYELW